MATKQSAIEWAEDKLSDLNSAVANGEIAPEEYHEIRVNIWKKAKAMEKEQIKHAIMVGISIGFDDNPEYVSEKFYNITYANAE